MTDLLLEQAWRRGGPGNTVGAVKRSEHFDYVRTRPDRAIIRDEWILKAVHSQIGEQVQRDGRIRRWAQIPEMGGRILRVVLLPDRQTVHNAFFDRRFKA